MGRSSSFFAPAAALLVVGGVSLIDVRASHAADEALAVRSNWHGRDQDSLTEQRTTAGTSMRKTTPSAFA